jgi:hypothetical protein
VRRAFTTFVAACSIGGCVLATGWALQGAALPRPEPADLVGAAAIAWLAHYRLVFSTIRIRHQPIVHGRCLQGWFRPRARRHDRGSLLRLDGGTTILAATDDTWIEGLRAESHALGVVQTELAGCGGTLVQRIAAEIQSGSRLGTQPAAVMGRPALALRIPGKRTVINLYVALDSGRPIALRISAPHFFGTSDLRLVKLTPQLVHSLQRTAR